MKYIMRNYNWILLFIIVCCLLSTVIDAEEKKVQKKDLIIEQLDKLDLGRLQQEVNKINQKSQDMLPDINVKKILFGLARGDLKVGWEQVIRALFIYLREQLTLQLDLLGQIIILAIISAVLKIFQDSFESQTISNAANLLIFLVLAVLLLNSYKTAISVGVDTINNMVSFMNSLVPVLLTLLVSLGAITSATIFHPVTYLIISALTTGIKNIILPMIFISFVLTVVNNISDEFNISRLAGLFKEYSLALFSFALSILFGEMLLQGGFAAVSDSLTLRTAEFLSGKFIPVIGGVFSSALGLIVNCSLLLKNALSLVGVLAIIIIIVYPLLKILAMIMIYKIAAALLQPICDNKLVNMFNSLGNNLMIVFGIVLAVALMFFIVITIIVGTANMTVMMR